MAKAQAFPGSTNLIARPREDTQSYTRSRAVPKPPKHTLREETILFYTMLKRAFLSKLRNRTNLLTTLLEAPLLAFLISSVLKYSEDEHYTFATAFHVPTYLFMSLVVAMFLGLTNSADDLLKKALANGANADIWPCMSDSFTSAPTQLLLPVYWKS